MEKYKHRTAYVCLSDMDINLIAYLVPIVYMDDTDEKAKRFDNFTFIELWHFLNLRDHELVQGQRGPQAENVIKL